MIVMTVAAAVTAAVGAAQKKNIGCKLEYAVEEYTVSRYNIMDTEKIQPGGRKMIINNRMIPILDPKSFLKIC